MAALYTVHPLQTAKTRRPSSFYTYLRDNGLSRDIYYGPFLLKGPDINILVDTGCTAAQYAKGSLGGIEDVASLDEALAGQGLGVQDINAVIMTHLHFDHTANLHRFGHCPVYVQKTELDHARDPHPYFAGMYVQEFIDGVEFTTIDGDQELFEGISVALMPGHTPGSQAVLVDTEHGRTAVSGFCCVRDNFAGPDSAIPGIHGHVEQAHDSIFRLIDMADFVYPNHDDYRVKL